ncbi:MAG: hypothetical protein HY568_04750 [Candidatus Latescibacteria bacterium]|nr:hypothetical protein [Candidatus Latescibacterota bacterium]
MATGLIGIIGAGPIGLEAALLARELGHRVRVYEAGAVGEHFLRYGPVRLFTPFHMNATERGRKRLRAAGLRLPADDAILTAEEFRERYLVPLSRLPDLEGSITARTRVTGIGREGLVKGQSIGPDGNPPRASRRFLIRVQPDGGAGRFERADAVIDASGVYACPNATGPGGLPALGEESLGSLLEQHLPAITREARARYAGRRILLIGDGRSAANALADIDALVREGEDAARTRVEWIHRDRGGPWLAPVPAEELERLPSLRDLDSRANRIAREAPWLNRRPGAEVASYRLLPSGEVEVTLAARGTAGDRAAAPREGAAREGDRLVVDRVLALVGYRPDLSLFRELQVHLCYASEGPMALAAAILASRPNAGAAGSAGAPVGCLSQSTHGPESLKSPEPDFYVLGAKSYGRNPNFLLSLGHRQIEDALGLIGSASGITAAAR